MSIDEHDDLIKRLYGSYQVAQRALIEYIRDTAEENLNRQFKGINKATIKELKEMAEELQEYEACRRLKAYLDKD